MDDTGGVGDAQGVGNLAGDRERLLDRNRATRDQRLEAHTVDQLHDDGVDAVLVDDVVDRHDVRVIEGRGGAGFLEEPALPVLVRHGIGRQHLERHGALEQGVAGPVDHAHPAGTQFANDLVVRESPADQGGGADYMPFSWD